MIAKGAEIKWAEYFPGYSYGLFGIFNVDVAEYLHDLKCFMNHAVLNVLCCEGATMTTCIYYA